MLSTADAGSPHVPPRLWLLGAPVPDSLHSGGFRKKMRKEMVIEEPNACWRQAQVQPPLGPPALAAPLIALSQCVGHVPRLLFQIITGLENRLEVTRIFHELADTIKVLIAMFVSSCSPKSCLGSLGCMGSSIKSDPPAWGVGWGCLEIRGPIDLPAGLPLPCGSRQSSHAHLIQP